MRRASAHSPSDRGGEAAPPISKKKSSTKMSMPFASRSTSVDVSVSNIFPTACDGISESGFAALFESTPSSSSGSSSEMRSIVSEIWRW